MKVKAQALTQDVFEPFGSFVLPQSVDAGVSSVDYRPDQLVSTFAASNMASLSVLRLAQREFCTEIAEMHEYTEEILGGFQNDVVFHVAAPTIGKPEPKEFVVFRLPAYGFIRLKRKVWHHAPFPVNQGMVQGVVILPPFTYTHDSIVIRLDEKIEISL